MLLIKRFGLRHHGGSVVVMAVDRGVGGNGSVRRVDIFNVVGGSPSLLDFLDAGLPNFSSCPASFDSNHSKGDYISKNYKVPDQHDQHDRGFCGAYGVSS